MTAPQNSPAAALKGWTIEELPCGTLKVQSPSYRWVAALCTVVYLSLVGYDLRAAGVLELNTKDLGWLGTLGITLLFCSPALFGVKVCAIREEWRVGDNSVTVRTAVLGFIRERSYSSAALC